MFDKDELGGWSMSLISADTERASGQTDFGLRSGAAGRSHDKKRPLLLFSKVCKAPALKKTPAQPSWCTKRARLVSDFQVVSAAAQSEP